MIKVAVSGSAGRMGKEIISAVKECPDRAVVSGATEVGSSPHLGENMGEGITITSNAEEVIKNSDVLIDFTSPDYKYQRTKVLRYYPPQKTSSAER